MTLGLKGEKQSDPSFVVGEERKRVGRRRRVEEEEEEEEKRRKEEKKKRRMNRRKGRERIGPERIRADSLLPPPG